MTNRQLFLTNLAQTSDYPLALEIIKAEGSFMYDVHGKAYIDLISGIAVSNVGHRHPKVVAAIKDQTDKYLHLMVYGEYIQSPQVKLAAAIAKTLDHTLSQVYFTNSGTEAIEGAMKLAKRYTGRTQIVACFNAYHGSTQGALSLGDEHFKQNFRPLLPDIQKIRFNEIDDIDLITHKTAAVIIEAIGGESGVRVPSKNYLKAIRKKCTETGTLMILDEVQTGFGRTGNFWAHQDFDFVPDILVCAKGMGGGMPIGAFISSETILNVLKDNPILGHITTFGGHPVSAAASLATLDVIFDENLLDTISRKHQLFKDLFVHPKIKAFRGKGLMMAIEFENFDMLQKIIQAGLSRGVITDWFLYCDNSMRICPPLTISDSEIIQACQAILESIEAAYAAS